MKLKITAILEYDADLMHGDDAEATTWFRETILRDPDLWLHSNELGDAIGTVAILSTEEVN